MQNGAKADKEDDVGSHACSEDDIRDGREGGCCRWVSAISVEPVMFLYMFAFMITSVVEQAFFVDRACRVDLRLSDEICSNLQNETFKDDNTEVQVVVSTFFQWNQIVSHAPPILMATLLGAWSDRHGRKGPLLLGLVGKLFYSAALVLNASQADWPLSTVLWSAALPSALTGADVAIFANCFSYLADVTTREQRTLRVAVLDVVYLSTMPTGVALGKYLWAGPLQRSYTLMFAVNACLMLAAVVYAAVALRSRTAPGHEPLPRRADACCADFWDWRAARATLATLARRRPRRRRAILCLIVIAVAFYTFQRDEKNMMYLYTQLVFHWSADVYSDFKTFQSAAYVLGVLLGVPLMSRLLRLSDTTVVMVGAVAHATARLLYAFASTSVLLYVGAGIAGLGPVVIAVLRSIASKVVPLPERGKLFALLAVADNAVPLVSGVLYSQLYNATIRTLPSAIFWLTIASEVVVFSCTVIIRIFLRRAPLDAADVETTGDSGET
ncbi:proton-coupled folate transporter [Schistocerca americana]|uniref:proton-coupled folate transporter n=1 Tax=Schistocerca americana TaxID=7009 RepID=UPI001F503562|nr:proton-coupled folate transporter [Schistocerca americana]